MTVTTVTATQTVTTTMKAAYKSPPNVNGKKREDKSEIKKAQINHHKSHNIDFSRSLRIAKGLFASFMLFTICW